MDDKFLGSFPSVDDGVLDHVWLTDRDELPVDSNVLGPNSSIEDLRPFLRGV